MVLHLTQFQVNQDKTAQNSVVEHQVNYEMGVVDGDALLPSDKGKAFAQFEQELLQMVTQQGLELGF